MRAKKCYLFVCILCLIISCSLVKTAYNKAPELAIWWLDDFFDFTSAQKTSLSPPLQKLHQWHRKTQLTHYVSLLQSLQADLAKEQISPAETCGKLDEIKQHVYTLQLESIAVVTEIAPLLSADQLQYFKTKLTKRTEKWKSEWWQETKDEQIKVRLAKLEDYAEKVYGDLSEAQLNQLKQSLTQTQINPEISYVEIQRRNEDAFAILNALQNKSLSAEERSELVKAGFDRIQKSPNQEYQAYAETMTKNTCERFANLHASTSEKQKLHAKNWLQDYILQLNALVVN
jgi:Family of unknown function (DUF6279)